MRKGVLSNGVIIKKGAFLKLMKFFFWLLIVSQLAFFALPQIASADLWDDQEGMTGDIGTTFGSAGGTPPDIRVIVARVISAFLGLLGILFLVLIVVSGYKWMMARGEESKVTEAKDQMQTSVIGLAIILAAWGITVFVFNSILKATDPTFSVWGI